MIGGKLWFKLSVNIKWISGTSKLVRCQILCWEGVKE